MNALRPGWKTSEAWLAGVAVLAAVGIALFAADAHLRDIAMAGVPAVSVFYLRHRAQLKSLFFAALPQGNPMDIDATIDAFVQKFVASKIPATAALQPECDAAIAAAEALAHKALEVYAVKLLAKKAPQLIDSLKAVFPNAGL